MRMKLFFGSKVGLVRSLTFERQRLLYICIIYLNCFSRFSSDRSNYRARYLSVSRSDTIRCSKYRRDDEERVEKVPRKYESFSKSNKSKFASRMGEKVVPESL